jgi:DNA-directed RNA polymerase subunit M/transcription elongation factor TFIIS
MKKLKPTKEVLIECNTCGNSIEVKGVLHCMTKIKDVNDIKDSSIVSTMKECGMFKIKKEKI